MGIESTTTISGLVTTNPTATDPVYKATDHFWLLKSVLKTTFPGKGGQGFAKAITATEDEINSLSGVKGGVQAALDALWKAMYPVGSVYINASDATNPGTLLGFGTWVRFGEGRVLVSQAAADPHFGTAGQTGGSKASALPLHNHGGATSNETANHTHGFESWTGSPNRNGSHGHDVNDPGHSHAYTKPNQAFTGPNAGVSLTNTTGAQTSHEGTGISIAWTDTNHEHHVSGFTSGMSNSHAHNIPSQGVDASATNMQPYVTVYMWKRSA